MAKGPEIFDPASPEINRLSPTSFARRLRNFTSDVINSYKSAPFMEKASTWFLGLGVADGLQVVINRFVLNPNSFIGGFEAGADFGMVCAAYNLRRSPFKWLGMVEGSMGVLGSALLKTGNPDFFYPAFLFASISGLLGPLHVVLSPGRDRV